MVGVDGEGDVEDSTVIVGVVADQVVMDLIETATIHSTPGRTTTIPPVTRMAMGRLEVLRIRMVGAAVLEEEGMVVVEVVPRINRRLTHHHPGPPILPHRIMADTVDMAAEGAVLHLHMEVDMAMARPPQEGVHHRTMAPMAEMTITVGMGPAVDMVDMVEEADIVAIKEDMAGKIAMAVMPLAGIAIQVMGGEVVREGVAEGVATINLLTF